MLQESSINDLKRLRSLFLKKNRYANRLFILEGYLLIKEAMISGYPLENIFFTQQSIDANHGKELLSLCNNLNVAVKSIDPKVLHQISDTKNNQGILAICKMRDEAEVFDKRILVLYEISDPGNMGTLLRTAAWFGIRTVIISEKSADPYNPKVVRSAMGAHFLLEIKTNVNTEIFDKLKQQGYTIAGAVMDGQGMNEPSKSIPEKWALVLGSEAHGFPDSVHEQFDKSITIPGYGKIDSLNVAVAGGILLHHFTAKSDID
jgi:TrmH family RNA methyltransferase